MRYATKAVGFSMISSNDSDLTQHFTEADHAMYAQKKQHKQRAGMQQTASVSVSIEPQEIALSEKP